MTELAILTGKSSLAYSPLWLTCSKLWQHQRGERSSTFCASGTARRCSRFAHA